MNSPATLTWSDQDADIIRYSRGLAMDAVQTAGNGHPGTAMSLAPVAYLLFRDFVRHDPADPTWLGRDRFVLSAGHTSLTLYTQLFLSGIDLELPDFTAFRTWNSKTPGHPEFGHTPGVETSTGPLGQGVATAVGMAMALRYEQALFDPSDPSGSPFDQRVWVLASDGDLQEGISGEASSFAGTHKLGNLCVLWDDNRMTIEGNTRIAFTEDVRARYEAYGWATHVVRKLPTGDVDLVSLTAALQAARAEDSRPTFIQVETTIAWPAPNAQDTAAAHGSALGEAEVAATKEVLGLDPAEHFVFPSDLVASARADRRGRGAAQRAEWQKAFDAWQRREPDRAELLDRLRAHALPAGFAEAFPTYELGSKMATRQASGEVLNAVAALMPELWGGSADLAGSNNTTIIGADSFLPDSPNGRVIHFGVREHAMGAILNGIALDGLTRPFGGTFLVFSDYMKGALRLAALMDLPVTYVWSHDSIGLGEDGPTHQPVEHLWSLRALPNLAVIRPADANETSAGWQAILSRRSPAGLILTRQNVPTVSSASQAVDGVSRGAYVLSDQPDAEVLLLATGSEVHLALEAQELLREQAIASRVVSMPCTSWFDAQDSAYRDAVLPPGVTARVAVEAGATLGWWKYVGTHGRVIGLDHFGASAAGPTLFAEYGITADAVVSAAIASLEDARGK
jgi:transketolase